MDGLREEEGKETMASSWEHPLPESIDERVMTMRDAAPNDATTMVRGGGDDAWSWRLA